ncbi:MULTISPECIES: succinylglutamate desuccinylase/aspartoacylase family protein [Mesorhizobium]|uniref:succinylglutamate desuccinylase/aspartoacylase family protein n=1 Tax=Mesorhizobium TaxID=68287 RepID=UPI0007ECF731|nr:MULTISPECIES: succinylglutamate desuccinylase/aspartoacylase family protein [Mesorhizobium]TPJ45944.1 succinylglutamate desuccinylase/aspartoacylase family protein [Mesorhizobium sp. B2-6-6]ARP67249.1 peptidase M14 [Mesorhizobium sp. WSM1497]MCA0002840.1 succinylglutamate desuccinylase/aspartoacylase family protein [Mesorhizobium sp. B264B2A]MCA0008429.1 succinylglutamate desuccinylase/aspartoacylase family protein [Mesorhizobium sp. B264B1B]MCA0014593.1 succinylglutamate desuccinylase/aspa
MSEAPHLTFDLETPGVSRGHLVVPGGADSGELSLPIFSLNKGEGPRLLVTGGNHGNELEGPLVARRLIEWLPEAQTCGRVIVLPVLNPLAVQAWSRNTPLDGLNLNRVFPGRGDGSVTERIADAVSRVLLPMADTIFDLHSFGPAWDFPPAATTHPIADRDLMARTVRMAEAFKLPVTLVWEYNDTVGMFDILAQNQGKVFVCTEFGGGTVGADNLAIFEAGVRNALIALGLVEGKAEYPTFLEKKSGQILETRPSDELKSPATGIFEPRCSVLDEVKQGALIGILHPMDSLSAKPIGIRAPGTSIVLAIRSGRHVHVNEEVAIVARPQKI